MESIQCWKSFRQINWLWCDFRAITINLNPSIYTILNIKQLNINQKASELERQIESIQIQSALDFDHLFILLYMEEKQDNQYKTNNNRPQHIFNDQFKKKSSQFARMVLQGCMGDDDPLFFKLLMFQLETPHQQRAEAQREAIVKIMKEYCYLKQLNNNLNDALIEQILKIIKIERYAPKEILYQVGQNDEHIYIIVKGKINIVNGNQIRKYKNKSQDGLTYLEAIDCKNFETKEDLNILQKQQGNIKGALAYALQESYVLKVKSSEYKRLLKSSGNLKSDHKILAKNPFFSYFSKTQIKSILNSAEQEEHFNNNYIYRKGDSAQELYYLKEGEVVIKLEVENHPKSNLTVSTLSYHTLFGESECLKNIARNHTAIVVSSKALIFVIKMQNIEQVLKERGQNLQMFKQKVYHELVSRKQRWREKKSEELKNFEKSILSKQNSPNTKSLHVSQSSKNVVKKFIHNSNEIQDKLKNNSFIINMQNKYSISKPISFLNPLFIRKDFPQLQPYLRRYQNQQKRIKTKLSLPRL